MQSKACAQLNVCGDFGHVTSTLQHTQHARAEDVVEKRVEEIFLAEWCSLIELQLTWQSFRQVTVVVATPDEDMVLSLC